MKNYVVTFSHEKGYSDFCPEDMFFTEKGLNQFLDKFEAEYKENYEKSLMSFKKEKDNITIDGDFVIFWKEYQPPKEPTFVSELPEYMEISVSNSGHDDTCLTIDIY